jgi:hypothetical protein
LCFFGLKQAFSQKLFSSWLLTFNRWTLQYYLTFVSFKKYNPASVHADL